jgi:predicted nucleic acid-binding protein
VIILDASVLIAHFRAMDPHHARADRVFTDYAVVPMGVSTVTLAEVLVGPARYGRLRAVETSLRNLDVEEIRLAQDAAVRLAVLRAETRLKVPDCCVLLAAEDSGADTVATFDDRLAKVAQDRGLTVAN